MTENSFVENGIQYIGGAEYVDNVSGMIEKDTAENLIHSINYMHLKILYPEDSDILETLLKLYNGDKKKVIYSYLEANPDKSFKGKLYVADYRKESD